MSKTYVFTFFGTKEDFFNYLNASLNHASYEGKFFYFNDYIVKLVDNEIHFGVERGGHSGGYWYIPTITEFSDRIVFSGTIQYVGPADNRGKIKKTIDSIGEFLLLILVLPIVWLYKFYALIEWTIRKVFNRPKPKTKTTEERLHDLMEGHFGCFVEEMHIN